MKNKWKKCEEVLKKEGIAVIPTDTIYGIVCSAFNRKAINKIYKLKGRNRKKKLIVLISSIEDLKKFKIKHSNILKNVRMFKKETSVIINGTAFRLIGKRNKNLFNLIKKVGPIATTSVNPQGLKPAQNVTEAKKYFGSQIDLYISGGTKKSKPSTLIKYQNNRIIIIRQGEVKIRQNS